MPLYIKIYAGEYSSNTNFSCHRIKVINSLEEKKKKFVKNTVRPQFYKQVTYI